MTTLWYFLFLHLQNVLHDFTYAACGLQAILEQAIDW
jgi:hypothetical protein